MSYRNLNAFGLDISDSSIELIFLDTNKKMRVFLREKLPFGVVTNGKIKDKQFLVDVLTKMKEQGEKKLNTKNIVLSLPENKIFAHVFSVPNALKNNVKVILKLAQEQIPLNLNEAIFDYKIIEDKYAGKKEKQIFFVAVEQALVYDYLEVIKQVELKVIAIDIEPNSMARALRTHKNIEPNLKNLLKEKINTAEKTKKEKKNKKEENKKEENVEDIIKKNQPPAEVIVDIGAKFTVITIFYENHIFPSISVPVGGQKFTQIIQETLKTKNYEEAEKIKKKLKLKSKDYKLVEEQLRKELDKIIHNIKSFITYFEDNNDITVKTIYVCGGASHLVGLRDYFHQNLDLVCTKLNPEISATQELDLNLYINAIGLALRGISKDPVSDDINLLPPAQRQLLVEQQARSVIIYTSLVILFLSSLLLASFNIVLSDLYFDLDGLQKANASLESLTEGTRYQEIKTHIQELNDGIQLAKQSSVGTYSVQQIYNYFYSIIPKNVIINQFSYRNQNSVHYIEVAGFALKRADVLNINKILQETPFFEGISNPLGNILNKENIRFNFSFSLNLDKFQQYLEEEKIKEEEAKKIKEAVQNGTGGVIYLDDSQQKESKNVGAFSTNDGTSTTKQTDAFSANNDVAEQVLSDKANLINTEDLKDLSSDIGNITGEITEDATLEETNIEEALTNQTDYPFQEQIHKKVGDVFVKEQNFVSTPETTEEN